MSPKWLPFVVNSLLLLLPLVVHSSHMPGYQWRPTSKSAAADEVHVHKPNDLKQIKLAGDVMIGGLFPIHEDGSSAGMHCGEIKLEKGIQRMEAMLYAVDQINSDPKLLPGIRLGVYILDTCHQDTHALEQTLELVRETFAADIAKKYTCSDYLNTNQQAPKPIVAVIGAASSQVSAMIANVLRLFHIPQISYSSTSVELSDKSRFGYFSRVVPPDNFQAEAIVDVVQALEWNFVAVIADEGSYGEPAFEAFQLIASKRGICISAYEKIRRHYRDEDFTKMITRLSEERSVGVVLFCHEDNIKKITLSVVKLGLISRFAWVGSDNWGTKRSILVYNPSSVLGAITIQQKTYVVKDFDRYFISLDPNNYTRNVWFHEFWENRFNCSITSQACRARSLGKEHVQEDYVPYVIEAVYLLANALHNMISNTCGNVSFHHCKISKKIDGKTLLHYIRNFPFIGPQGDQLVLDSKGDRRARYNIYQFQGLYKYYVPVGEWAGKLTLNLSLLREGFPRGLIPTSTCSDPCKEDEFRTTPIGSCCWTCLPCNTQTSIMPNSTSCLPCDVGFLPNSFKNQCLPMVPQIIEWDTWWAVVPATFSAVGIAATCFVVYMFIKYNNTPAIKASGRELCYVMLIGIFCSYLITYPMLNPPSKITCGILRMGIGLCSCIIYASIFTKTLRLARIFNSAVQQMKSIRFLSPMAQIVICLIIVTVYIFIALIWLIAEPPDTAILYPDRMTAIRSCKGATVTFPLSMIYNVLLIILCTVYAFKTRKIPENFNETKYIGFTMYATCIIWLAFIPIYFGTNQNFKIQTTSLCMCISLSGTVALCCFFAPKVYIVLFQPQKNTFNNAKHSYRTVGMMRDHIFTMQTSALPYNLRRLKSNERLVVGVKNSISQCPETSRSYEMKNDSSQTDPDEQSSVDRVQEPLIKGRRTSSKAFQHNCINTFADEISSEIPSETLQSRMSSAGSALPTTVDYYGDESPDTSPSVVSKSQSLWLTPDRAEQLIQRLRQVTAKDGTTV
ncbi:Metabotropic glutamate receptor 3 [Trichinella sp. T6]|nr:Metabotropic glutamate receptor 3 [Trichinella sp. T6]